MFYIVLLFLIFSEKKRLEISWEPYDTKMMNYMKLSSLISSEKKKMSSAAAKFGAFLVFTVHLLNLLTYF